MNAELEKYLANDIAFKKFLEKVPTELIEKASLTTIPRKGILFSKGDPVDYLYIIINGEIQVMNELPDGKQYVFVTLSRYDFLGDLSILSDYMTYVGTVIASNELSLIRFPASSIIQTIEDDFDFYKLLTKELTRKIFTSSSLRGNDIYLTSLDKLKHFLVSYYEDHSTTMSSLDDLTVQKTHEEIANELGLSRKSVTRSVQKLKVNNQLTVSNGKIILSEQQYQSLWKDIGEL